MKQLLICAAVVVGLAVPTAVFAGEPGDSQRLERAKDFIADEQWERAIEQLKAAAADAKERNKDEALFWLAHSQHQARDLAAALQTIADLEGAHASSRWVKPARSLRIEIAQKLRRDDVLWMTAAPPAPFPAATPAPPKVANSDWQHRRAHHARPRRRPVALPTPGPEPTVPWARQAPPASGRHCAGASPGAAEDHQFLHDLGMGARHELEDPGARQPDGDRRGARDPDAA